MRIHTHRLGLFAIALMSIGLIQCAEKDADKVGDAQICLNEGRSPSTCMAKVAGLETPAAYSIRCASMFIAERFTDPQKYIDAFAQLNSNSSSLKTFMGLLTFSSGGTIATDNANAATTFDYCYRSGARGALVISSFGYLATSLYKFFADSKTANAVAGAYCSATPGATGYDLPGCITGYAGSGNGALLSDLSNLTNAGTSNAAAASVQSAMGSIIITTYTLSCSSGGMATSQICRTLLTAINNGGGIGNPRNVAVQFINVATQ